MAPSQLDRMSSGARGAPPISDYQHANGQPIIAAIDEVSGVEIIAGSTHGGLYSWENDCDVRSGSPLLQYGEINGTPMVCDLDKNDGGKLELITKDLSGMVSVYELKGTGPVQWGQFARDGRHSSWYESPVSFGGAGEQTSEPVVKLEQNTPNPFNPVTSIRFTLRDDRWIKLAIYDAAGRVVRSLVNEAMRPGSYSARWDGTNDGGHAVSSGVYFCRMRAGEFGYTTKMLLIK
jgi:hypothetical protein